MTEATAVDDENVIVDVFSDEAERGKKYFRWINMGDAGNVEGYVAEYVPEEQEILRNGQANFEAVGNPYTYDRGDGGGSMMGIHADNRMNDKQEYTISYRFQIGNPEYSSDVEKQAESSIYLTMQVKCTDKGWKVVSCGLEK